MASKVEGLIKLQVPAGSAAPAPPIGPALGQRGLNIMDFCKAFNAQTQNLEKGIPCPTIIKYHADKSFTFEVRTPPVSFLLKKAAGVASGSASPGRSGVGKVNQDQLREIAAMKMKDLNANDEAAAMKMVAGSARSLGLEVTD